MTKQQRKLSQCEAWSVQAIWDMIRKGEEMVIQCACEADCYTNRHTFYRTRIVFLREIEGAEDEETLSELARDIKAGNPKIIDGVWSFVLRMKGKALILDKDRIALAAKGGVEFKPDPLLPTALPPLDIKAPVDPTEAFLEKAMKLNLHVVGEDPSVSVRRMTLANIIARDPNLISVPRADLELAYEAWKESKDYPNEEKIIDYCKGDGDMGPEKEIGK